MADFRAALERTLKLEGGYSDHAADPGGKTRWGIAEGVARENGYLGDMRELPREIAERIYLKRYWFPLRLSDVESQEMANEIFDAAVNCGLRRAALWWQMGLNALNARGTLWADICEDGAVGSETMKAMATVEALERVETLRKIVVVLRGGHYVALARADERKEAFVRGWIDKRVNL